METETGATERIRAHGTVVKKLGHWTSARQIDVKASAGTVVLELRSPEIAAGAIEIGVDATRSVVKLLVPDDAIVEHDELRRIGRGRVKDMTGTPNAAGRRIVLTGELCNAEIRVQRGGVATLSALATPENSMNDAPEVTVGSVTSKDGTTIGYRKLGRGPALIVVCGAMVSSKSHLKLAESLADAFTVYLPDRRGRGLSGPRRAGYGMAREIEDLDALLQESGARLVFGISAGALVCLRAALRPSELRRIALYEPALIVDESAPAFETTRLERELTEGNVAAALVTGMKESRMGPPILNVIPRGLLERMTRMAMKSEEKKAAPDDVTMRMLAPALREDFQLINETKGALASFGHIDTDVLVLGGSKSPAYLRHASDALVEVLPHATRIELAGLDHGGATERDGKPEVVADALRHYFT